MNLTVFLFGALVYGICILLLVCFFDQLRNRFYGKSKVMTFQEIKFYRFLQDILGYRYDILSQVRLANLVTIPDNHFSWNNFNLIGLKCVDFVICDKLTGETKLVIELDDPSHRLFLRKKRDIYVDSILKKSGIEVYHQILQKDYSADRYQYLILEKNK